MRSPDVNKHFFISVIKSVLRITGCVLGFVNLAYVFILFFVAECLGILEEIL